MKSNGVGVALGVVALLALAIPHGSAAAEPARASAQVTSAGAAAEAPERVENLRLQRITSGPMRGRLVVAGSLDHLPNEGVAHDVVIRMTMTVPRGDGRSRTVGRKVLDYRLPAGVSPQNLTLRWLLSERESRLVDRAGDAARVTVVVRESRVGGPMAKHVKVAERLRVEPHPVLRDSTTSARSATPGVIFIPAGFYSRSIPWGTNGWGDPAYAMYYLWTSEDDTGAPYVDSIGFSPPLAEEYSQIWLLIPAWKQAGKSSGSPGPGSGYIYANGETPSWSYNTTGGCIGNPPVTANGAFSGANGQYASMAWSSWICGSGFFATGHAAGSTSLTAQ